MSLCRPQRDVREEDVTFEQGQGPAEPRRIRHYYNRGDIDLRELLDSDSSITLGPPLRDTTEMKRAIQLLLRKLKRELGGVRVIDSEISYRGT